MDVPTSRCTQSVGDPKKYMVSPVTFGSVGEFPGEFSYVVLDCIRVGARSSRGSSDKGHLREHVCVLRYTLPRGT